MDYCAPLGIPHRVFLGRPCWGEVLWTDDDRRKALEWAADKADHCSSCHQRRSDWLDENGKELRDPPFEVVEILCPGCQEIAWHTEGEKERRPGIHLGFRRVPEGRDEE